MDMSKMVIIYLLLDLLVVAVIGVLSFHAQHGGWQFFLINGVRLGVMAGIVALWRSQTAGRWVEQVLLGKRPSQD